MQAATAQSLPCEVAKKPAGQFDLNCFISQCPVGSLGSTAIPPNLGFQLAERCGHAALGYTDVRNRIHRKLIEDHSLL